MSSSRVVFVLCELGCIYRVLEAVSVSDMSSLGSVSLSRQRPSTDSDDLSEVGNTDKHWEVQPILPQRSSALIKPLGSTTRLVLHGVLDLPIFELLYFPYSISLCSG